MERHIVISSISSISDRQTFFSLNLVFSNRSIFHNLSILISSFLMLPNYRLKLTAPSVTPLAAYIWGGQASRPRPAA